MQAQKPNIARIFFYYNIKKQKKRKTFYFLYTAEPGKLLLAGFCQISSVKRYIRHSRPSILRAFLYIMASFSS